MNEPIVFSRRFFIVHVVHWAILAIAVPVVSLIGCSNVFAAKKVFGAYYIIAFLSTILLALLPPAYRFFGDRRSVKRICPGTERLAKIVSIVMILFVLIAISSFILVRKMGGLPEYYDGVYCIWNHGFIRTITRQEYLRLSFIERAGFCAGVAFVRSFYMRMCCSADQII